MSNAWKIRVLLFMVASVLAFVIMHESIPPIVKIIGIFIIILLIFVLLIERFIPVNNKAREHASNSLKNTGDAANAGATSEMKVKIRSSEFIIRLCIALLGFMNMYILFPEFAKIVAIVTGLFFVVFSIMLLITFIKRRSNA